MTPPPSAAKPNDSRDLSRWPGLNEYEREVITKLPAKAYRVWEYLADRVGQGVCRVCLNEALRAQGDAPTQLAAQVRTLRVRGFAIPKKLPSIDCPVHGKRTRDLLTAVGPEPMASRVRWAYTAKELATIHRTLGGKDAYDFDASSKLEVDHRVPMLRAGADEERVDPDDADAVREKFQLLTPVHNLMKSRACESCVDTGVRPPFLGMPNALDGDATYRPEVGCSTCPFAYPERWRAQLAALVGQQAGAEQAD